MKILNQKLTKLKEDNFELTKENKVLISKLINI